MSRAKSATSVESATVRREKREKRLEKRLRELEGKVQSNPANVGNPRKARNAIIQKEVPVNVPKVNGMISSGQCLDPMCRLWCEYQKRPWDAQTAYMGRSLDCLTNDGEPFCASAPAQRYATYTLAANSAGLINVHLLPEGYYNVVDDDLRVRRLNVSATDRAVGPLQLGTTAATALFGVAKQSGTLRPPITADGQYFWNSGEDVATASAVTPLVWPDGQASTPFTLQTSTNAGQAFRLVGFGVRIYPISDVANISGYAYASNIANYPRDQSTFVSATKGTPQWKQQAFSEKRVFEWSMGWSGLDCHYGHEVESQTTLAAATGMAPCRIVLGVEGADDGEKFVFEFFSFYRVIGSGIPGMLAGYKSPNEVAIQNAISASHSQDRRDVTKSVAMEHAMAHPVLHKIVHAGKLGIEAINAVKGFAGAIGFGG